MRCWHVLKVGIHLKWGNTKLRPYEAASAQLAWSVHVYHALSTNRIKLRLLPHFDIPTTDGSVHTMHEAITSGWCMVHITRVEAALYSLGVASLQVCTHLIIKGGNTNQNSSSDERYAQAVLSSVALTFFMCAGGIGSSEKSELF